MGRCAECSKALAVIGGKTGAAGRRKSIFYYGCSYHHTRGDTVCDNSHRARMQWLDASVLDAIQQALTPEAISTPWIRWRSL